MASIVVIKHTVRRRGFSFKRLIQTRICVNGVYALAVIHIRVLLILLLLLLCAVCTNFTIHKYVDNELLFYIQPATVVPYNIIVR